MFANVALVFSGQFVRYVSQMKVGVRVRVRARVRVRVGLGLGLGLGLMIKEHGEKGLSASRLAAVSGATCTLCRPLYYPHSPCPLVITPTRRGCRWVWTRGGWRSTTLCPQSASRAR